MTQELDQESQKRLHAERRAVDDLIRRLRETFPETPGDEIEATVRGRYAEFEGSRIRDFVPMLVERHARQLLRARRAEGAV